MELRPLRKKGIFFSLAAIIFLGILTIIISTSLRAPAIDTGLYSARSASAVRERVEVVYLPLLLKTIGTQMLHETVDDAYARNLKISLPRDFNQALENGTWGGAANYPLRNQTLRQALELLSNVSNTTGTNVTFTLKNVSIVQVGSFTARAQATINYTLRSTDGTVGYNRTVTVTAEIPLQGVVDLYYSESARTEGFTAPRRSFKALLPLKWNHTEFNRSWEKGLYMVNKAAPSVFNRLEGSTAASTYGVESLVDPAIAPPRNTTALDWEYFPRVQNPCTYSVNYPNLIVSYVTLTEYNLTNGTNVQSSPTCPVPSTWP